MDRRDTTNFLLSVLVGFIVFVVGVGYSKGLTTLQAQLSWWAPADTSTSTPVSAPACPNGIEEPPEECDDGNSNNYDNCDDLCRFNLNAYGGGPGGDLPLPPTGDLGGVGGPGGPQVPICGNGVLEPTEQCDDGNTVNKDGCDSTCLIEFNLAKCNIESHNTYVACVDFANANKKVCDALVPPDPLCAERHAAALAMCTAEKKSRDQLCQMQACQVKEDDIYKVCEEAAETAQENCLDQNTKNGGGEAGAKECNRVIMLALAKCEGQACTVSNACLQILH